MPVVTRLRRTEVWGKQSKKASDTLMICANTKRPRQMSGSFSSKRMISNYQFELFVIYKTSVDRVEGSLRAI